MAEWHVVPRGLATASALLAMVETINRELRLLTEDLEEVEPKHLSWRATNARVALAEAERELESLVSSLGEL